MFINIFEIYIQVDYFLKIMYDKMMYLHLKLENTFMQKSGED
ncbi:hypothetical protein [Terrisporobacter sp.]